MQCFIYKSKKKQELYLYILKKGDFSMVPQSLYQSLGEPIFVMDLYLAPERKLARESTKIVLQNLREKGYHLQIPPTTIPAPREYQ